jgi:hypothetical protein
MIDGKEKGGIMKKILSIILFGIALIFIIKLVILQFSFPELTNAQMLIKYWRQYVIFFVSLIVGTILFEEWLK